MNVVPIYLNAIASGKAKPAVLVMPNTDGGQQYGLQCLNDPGGVQDMTYVAEEVPRWAVANLRVQQPGPAWGVAGYSEGGYCAANIALQHPNLFGYAGSLSGYFAPIESQVPLGGKAGGTPVDVNDFARSKKLLLINSPDEYITRVPVTVSVPQFFLAAGAADEGDVQAAELFKQELLLRDAGRAADDHPRRRPPGDRLAGGADADARLDDAAARRAGGERRAAGEAVTRSTRPAKPSSTPLSRRSRCR